MAFLSPEEKEEANKLWIDSNSNHLQKIPNLWDTRDQGWCGSSWAVAPAATISVRLSIKTSKHWNLTRISKQEILSCGATDAWECGGGKDGLPGWQQDIMRNFHGNRVSCEEPSEWGCQGGDVARAWSYMEGNG